MATRNEKATRLTTDIVAHMNQLTEKELHDKVANDKHFRQGIGYVRMFINHYLEQNEDESPILLVSSDEDGTVKVEPKKEEGTQ